MASDQNAIKIVSDKINSSNIWEPNQNVGQNVNKVERKQCVASGVAPASSNILLLPTTFRQPPKIDATDRRQTETLYEDRCHTSKEILDDFKHVYRKQKQKKERTNIEEYQDDIGSEVLVRIQ